MSVQLAFDCGEQWLDALLADDLDDGPEPPPLLGYGRPATAKPRRCLRLWRPITNLPAIDNYRQETQP